MLKMFDLRIIILGAAERSRRIERGSFVPRDDNVYR